MDIINKDTYYNSIYQALIVNDSISDDPEGKGRYQIYIPEVHFRYEEEKDKYIKEKDKSKSSYKTLFPWAVSLVSGLEEGDQVYGSYINNLNNSFIILGKDARADELGSGGFDGSLGLDSILDLAMPIIIENEVGINRKNWPDGITDGQYGNITSNDNGAWSIGLIQWHGCRAFDILYQIAKADSNWTSKWSDQSLSIVSDLQSAVKKGSSSPNRNKWDKVVSDSSIINGTRKMLTSSIGKETQKTFARSETKTALDKLTQDPYNISNPAILIFCMDIMNQYGNGVNSVITGCLEKAASISKGKGTLIEQLKDFREYWRSKTSYIENGKVKYRYDSRRTNTYNYIVQLDKDGKLDCLTFTDLTELQGFKHIPEYGEYFWPTTASDQINCMYGDYTSSKKAAKGESTKYATYSGFKYNWAGLDHGSFHWGIDIAPKKAGVDGDALIACGSGEVVWVNGGGVDHRGSITTANPVKGPGQGNCIAIKMDKNKSHNFVYMHLCKAPTLKVGDKVKAGDVIGYMGSTGSSTGTHLHIGLHIDDKKDIWKTASTTSRPDPLPYFGKKVKGEVTSIKTTSNNSGTTVSGGTADDIIEYAKKYLGNAYKWGGKTPPNFDCSGLTHYVYKHFGYEIGLNTTAQRKVGIDVLKKDLQKADLVHFHNSDHVGLYIGNGQFIHAPKTGDVVKISKLSESYYTNHWLKGTRVLGHVKKS